MRLFPLVAAVVAVACVGCAGADKAPAHSAGDGPLAIFGDDRQELCMPQPADSRDATLGVDVLRNTGTEPLTVTNVSAVRGQGLRISEAVVIQLKDSPLFGGSNRWPPHLIALPEQAAQWQTRQPANGFRVPPRDGTNYNLLAHVVKEPGASEGSLHALRVEYTVGDRQYSAETNNGLTLKPACR